MRHKTFALLTATIVLISFFLIGVFNFVVDPYGKNHFCNASFNLIKATQDERVQKFNLIKNNPTASSFIFGSSRSLRLNPAIVEKITHTETLNIGFSSGTVDEYLLYIRYLIDTRKVDTIIIGIDLFSYSEGFRPNGIIPEELSERYDIKTNKPIENYFSFTMLKHSLDTIINNFAEKKEFDRIGHKGEGIFYDYLEASKAGDQEFKKYIEKNVLHKKARWNASTDTLSKNRLNELQKIKILCNQKNINLYLFMSPLWIKQITMKNNKFEGQKNLLRYIATNISPIWDYNAFSHLNTDPYLYHDSFHYGNKIADSILTELLTHQPMDQTLKGILVTPDNIDKYIQMVERKEQAYKKKL